MRYFSIKPIALGVILSCGGLGVGALAQAQESTADYSLSYNAGVVSEYSYRGLSQSARKPALQAGVDFSHKNGAYLGAWASTIRWIKDSGSGLRGSAEVDVYGGYKGSFGSLAYDTGALYYWYPRNNYATAGENANTLEVYGALSYGLFTAKLSYATTPLFGTVNSKGSTYAEIAANIDLGQGFSLVPHYGSQNIRQTKTYNDWSLTLNKDFSGTILSASVVGTDWNNMTLPGSGSKDLGETRFVLGLKRNF